MTQAIESLGRDDVLGRALAKIRELRGRLQALEAERSVAIVGVACRLPGGNHHPDALWRFLRDGGDAICALPAERWRAEGPRPQGGFLEDVASFDAGLFGISPREASTLDPQQRLFLETAWEALENAGQRFSELNGSPTGVFVGVTNSDYCQEMLRDLAPEELDAYCLTSNASTFAAGRLSYCLGLRGPSLSIDTACSSSLVAVHLACRSLRNSECSMALAGGVNVLLSPAWFSVLGKAGMLSPEARCKTFDARADGYVRGEGCVVFVLKRLSDAVSARDPIHAVLRGSSVNQDGRSAGVTVPNSVAQQDAIRGALEDARLPPEMIDYVEAHGTGTPLGDPIEVRALASVLCATGDREAPLKVGSIKANLGHLEPAAGAAGLLKVLLALRHQELPPQTLLREVNPELDLQELGITISTERKPWPRGERPRRAGVSSFGASGTNAHVIVEEAPPQVTPEATSERSVHLFTVSARSPQALAELARRHADHVEERGDLTLADVCYTANARAQLPERLAIPASNLDELKQGLRAAALDQLVPGASAGHVQAGQRPKIAFLFTGQGSQFPGMALDLYEQVPAFRRALDRCATCLTAHLDEPLLTILEAPAERSRLSLTRYAQPALFSIEYALAMLWRSWGITPDAVLGHSLGEYVAACVAGSIELEDCLELLCKRAALMQEVAQHGGMASVFTTLEHAARVISEWPRLSIAAVNGPDNVVISGCASQLEAALYAFTSQGVKSKRLQVSHAFHSPLLEPMLEAFEHAACNVQWRAPDVPLISNLTGRPIEPGRFSARYLREHTRAPVRFFEGVQWLYDHGFDTFVELGPVPSLSSMAKRFAPGPEFAFLPSMRPGHASSRTLLESLGALFVRGAEVDWAGLDADYPRRRISLPTYPFERRPYWYASSSRNRYAPPATTLAESPGRSLLGRRVASPLATVQFEALYSADRDPCLGDCIMAGQPVVNVGVYLEAAAQAWMTLHGDTEFCAAQGISVRAGFVLGPSGSTPVQLVLDAEGEAGERFSLHSLTTDDTGTTAWKHHADALLTHGAPQSGPLLVDAVRRRCADERHGETFYAQMAVRSLQLGSTAKWIEHLHCGVLEAVARMRAPRPGEADSYRIHPGLVDAAFQTVFACLPGHIDQDAIYMVVEIERALLGKAPSGASFSHARIRPGGDPRQVLVADVDVADETGKVFLRLEGALLKRTTPEALQASSRAPSRSPTPRSRSEPRPRVLDVRGPEQTSEARAWLRGRVAAVLRMHEADVDPASPLAALGFDSLMAVEVKHAALNELGVDLPLSDLLVDASVAELVPKLIARLPAVQASESPRASEQGTCAGTNIVQASHGHATRFEAFSMTDLQQAYLLGRTKAFELGGVSTYFFLEVDLIGIDLDRLERSLRCLIDRHDMLRAVTTRDSQLRVLPSVPPYHILRTDLRGLEPREVEHALAALHEECRDQVFATDRFPLFDVRATLLDKNRTRLHLGFDALIIDAWSTSMLFREWSQVYAADSVDVLAPIDLTFRDYVVALRSQEQRARYEAAAKYWRDRLASLPAAPPLPLAKAPASVEDPVFAHRSYRLSPSRSQAFKERARQAGVTPSAALCAAYAEVLSTWSNAPAFTLNLLFFNRQPLHPDVDRVLGNFSATTLLEVRSARGEDLRNRASRLQKQLASDLDHAAFSGVQVLRELHAGGDPRRARMPVVFASTINFHGREGEPPSGLAQHLVSMAEAGEQVHSSIRTPQVWLDHQVVEDAAGLVLNWDFVEELFPPQLIDTMFEAYVQLVARLADEDLAWTERQRSLLPEREQALRYQANNTSAPMPKGLLHEPFSRIAALEPQRTAVHSARRSLSYGELDQASNRVAHWLLQQGPQLGEFVAVVMERGWEQVVAVLGILKAGAAYVPIDAHLPHERRGYLLEQTGARQVLTQSWLRLEGLNGQAVLDVDAIDSHDLPVSPVEPRRSPDDLAYVIYTSGSTGLPKGVMIEHGSALNTVLDVNQRFQINGDSCVLALSALNFDLSVWDIFGVLAAGGRLVLPEPSALREPARWLELVQAQGVNVWNTVPALMEMFVDHLHGTQRLAPELKLVMMSGDWIPVALPGRIRAQCPNAVLYSLGGATEASIWSIVYSIEQVDPSWPSIPYGKAMTNQQMHVLDEALAPCPVWVPGHIYIGGVGLARGYLKEPNKTRASFVRHPLTGERLYRTGDLGRLLPSGDIEFLGREDSQVKIQGYRIELGEIEAALLSHEGVRAAAAAAVGEKRGSKRLVAWVVPHSPALQVSELHALLSSKLPEYAVPQSILILDALPLSANGKVDKSALIGSLATATEHAVAHVGPRTSLERILTNMWESLLERPVSVRQSFFDLGGNSLLAVRLMARIQQELGRELPLAALFESPTVEQLASLLERQTSNTPASKVLVPIQPRGTAPPLFCVHPVGGSVLCYAELARALGDDQPFWGLEAPGVEMADTIEQLATHYVDAICQFMPHGPYHLGGWSMGGAVAFEMARQLRARGEEVALLALIDVIEPPFKSPDRARARVDHAAMLAWFARDLSAVSGRPVELDASALRVLSEDAAMSRVLAALRAADVVGADVSDARLLSLFEVFARNLRALLAYTAKTYDGSAWFCRGTRDGASSLQNARAWLELAQTGELIEIDADHYSLLSAKLPELACALQKAVAAARGRR